MLRRIIAQLVASALLAERASERSLLVRWLVLWILRRAETTALDFVLDETGVPMAVEGFVVSGNGPDDAFALAAHFRALAAALCALVPLLCPFGRRPALDGMARGHFTPRSSRILAVSARKPYDTS